jgi:predicted DNA-binding WGR domain protein
MPPNWNDDFNMIVCTDGKHNKFWTFSVSSDGELTIRYGRIGTKGQTRTSQHGSSMYASSIGTRKMQDKILEKDYRRVTQREYDILLLQAHLLGNGNKFEFASLVVLNKDHDHLVEITPEEAVDPKHKPSMVVSFRLRDRRGSTEPFTVWFADDDAFELSGDKRVTMRSSWTVAGKLCYPLRGNRRITEGHRLYSLTEKLAEVIGRTVL